MRILIIEDEKKLADLIKTSLIKEGYAVDCLYDGEAGQRRLEMHHKDYDLLILDLMLPGKTGFEICKNIREQEIFLPILVLTAKSDTTDKVSMLDLGADDYLVKPFILTELLARVRALTRRPKTSLPQVLKFGVLELDPVRLRAFYDGKKMDFTLKEFRLLEYLLRNPNQAITRDQILDKVWDFEFDSFSNIVDVHVRNIRRKLGRKGAKFLETVRGIGYRLKDND